MILKQSLKITNIRVELKKVGKKDAEVAIVLEDDAGQPLTGWEQTVNAGDSLILGPFDNFTYDVELQTQ